MKFCANALKIDASGTKEWRHSSVLKEWRKRLNISQCLGLGSVTPIIALLTGVWKGRYVKSSLCLYNLFEMTNNISLIILSILSCFNPSLMLK